MPNKYTAVSPNALHQSKKITGSGGSRKYLLVGAGGSTGAADSAEGLGRLCGVGPEPTARATTAAVTGGPPNRRERTTRKI